MSAYTWKDRVLNMLEFWICLMQYIVEGYCTNYWIVIDTKVYPEHCQTFKMERFAKTIIPECRCAPGIFKGRKGEGVCGHFEFFSPRYS